MALIDDDWWNVRRKLAGAGGGSCRGAPYIRMRPTPTNSNTRLQQTSRALLLKAQRSWWEDLNSQMRDEYDNEAGCRCWYDQLDQYRCLTGIAYFVALHTRIFRAGWPVWEWAYDIYGGVVLESLSLTMLDSSTVRATFAPNPEYDWHGLALYGRVGVNAGVVVEPHEYSWWRSRVPSGWRLIGFGDLGETSPIDFVLPSALRSGTRLVCGGGLMSACGLIHPDWKMAEVAAA